MAEIENILQDLQDKILALQKESKEYQELSEKYKELFALSKTENYKNEQLAQLLNENENLRAILKRSFVISEETAARIEHWKDFHTKRFHLPPIIKTAEMPIYSYKIIPNTNYSPMCYCEICAFKRKQKPEDYQFFFRLEKGGEENEDQRETV